MITQIKNIRQEVDYKTNKPYYIIYFDYNNIENAFTYLSHKSIQYWASRGVTDIKTGMTINIFKVPCKDWYKIIDFKK